MATKTQVFGGVAFDASSTTPHEQLLLPIPSIRAETGAPCWSAVNRAAALLVDGRQAWPGGLGVLAGPAGSGKSFLARWLMNDPIVLASRSTIPRALHDLELEGGEMILIEDLDRVHASEVAEGEAAQRAFETAVFHLFNRIDQAGAFCLITARSAPASWNVVLRDLASRLSHATMAQISEPDHALMSAVVAQRMAERGLRIPVATAEAIARCIENRFDAAEEAAERLDRASMQSRERLTPARVRAVLGGAPQRRAA